MGTNVIEMVRNFSILYFINKLRISYSTRSHFLSICYVKLIFLLSSFIYNIKIAFIYMQSLPPLVAKHHLPRKDRSVYNNLMDELRIGDNHGFYEYHDIPIEEILRKANPRFY